VEKGGEMEVDDHGVTQEESRMQVKTAEEVEEKMASIEVSLFLIVTARY
jgi:hypothetical protein